MYIVTLYIVRMVEKSMHKFSREKFEKKLSSLKTLLAENKMTRQFRIMNFIKFPKKNCSHILRFTGPPVKTKHCTTIVILATALFLQNMMGDLAVTTGEGNLQWQM